MINSLSRLFPILPFLFLTTHSSAENLKEINQLCQNEPDFIACSRAYQGLPPLISLPSLNNSASKGPIAIKVIPYVSRARRLPAVTPRSFPRQRKTFIKSHNSEPWDDYLLDD